MKSRLGIVLLGIFIFLLGGVAGAVSHYLVYRKQLKPVATPAPPKPGEFLDRMAREFNLDNQQRESLRAIFHQSRLRYRELDQQYKPLWDAILTDTENQIKTIMRPDQRAKYEAFLKDWYSKPHGPPRPPPSSPSKSN